MQSRSVSSWTSSTLTSGRMAISCRDTLLYSPIVTRQRGARGINYDGADTCPLLDNHFINSEGNPQPIINPLVGTMSNRIVNHPCNYSVSPPKVAAMKRNKVFQ
jgi:hypothetical protein